MIFPARPVILVSPWTRGIGRHIPDDVHFTKKDNASDNHGKRNDWKVLAYEVDAPYMDVLSAKYVAPEETSQRCAERCAKSAVVDSNIHAVDRCPESPLGDRVFVPFMNVNPRLYYTAEKDRCSNVGARELFTHCQH